MRPADLLVQPQKVHDPFLADLGRLVKEDRNPVPECALVDPAELKRRDDRIADLEGQNRDLRMTVQLLTARLRMAKEKTASK